MADWQLSTPVAFLIFNRPDTTVRVFDEIRRARPPRLLVVADGPRLDWPGEAEACAATRAVVERVDWPCEVLTDYSDVNLGTKRRISSGLDWVFSISDQAMILEDDCLPHPSFFRFCEELLHTYRDDERVMHISGDNFQFGRRRGGASYYFTRYPHVWGWASWRRAWTHYDVEMRKWARAKRRKREAYLREFASESEKEFWANAWDGVSVGETDTWDFQWAFACLAQGALSVVPNSNLVSNIGFGADSTHTTDCEDPVANLPTEEVTFPLRHPASIARDGEADDRTAELFFGTSE